MVLPEAQALERMAIPLRGTMIFLQPKINTLPHGFPFMLEDGSNGFLFPASAALTTALLFLETT